MKLLRALLGLMAMVLFVLICGLFWQMVNIDGGADVLTADVAEYPVDVVVKPTTQHDPLLSVADVIFLVCVGGIAVVGLLWDNLIQKDRG